jgi:hypothetical protein
MHSEVFSNDEIVHYVFLKNHDLNYNAVVDDCFKITQLKGRKRFPFLIDMRSSVRIDEKARNFLSSSKFKSKIKAMALLVGSESSQEILDFFFAMNTKKLKTRIFVEKEFAIEWLKCF